MVAAITSERAYSRPMATQIARLLGLPEPDLVHQAGVSFAPTIRYRPADIAKLRSRNDPGHFRTSADPLAIENHADVALSTFAATINSSGMVSFRASCSSCCCFGVQLALRLAPCRF